MKRTWTLVRFGETSLHTSEHPVIYLNERDHPLGYGMATADQVYQPENTTLALLMSHPWSGWPEAVVVGSAALATQLNGGGAHIPHQRASAGASLTSRAIRRDRESAEARTPLLERAPLAMELIGLEPIPPGCDSSAPQTQNGPFCRDVRGLRRCGEGTD